MSCVSIVQRYIGRLQRLVTLHSQEPDKHRDELEDLIRARVRAFHVILHAPDHGKCAIALL